MRRAPIHNPHLRRFWLTFAESTWPRYVGVTAYSREEALALARNLFRSPHCASAPEPTEVVEEVDLSTLDPDHVLLNCGPPVWRGIWYPNLCLGAENTD